MIADAIRQAQRMHRAALEQTYDGRCTVRVQKKVPKENKSTGFEEEILLENQPCRIIFKSVQAAGEAEPAAGVSQDIRMLIAPEAEIPAGSRITVTQNGMTRDYSQSGIPAVYVTHQEIQLKLFERYA